MRRMARHSRPRGQGLVEFALVITLFMFLVVAVFEFAHLLFAYTMTAAGVREAARYGTASGPSPNGIPRYADCDGIRAAALRLGALGGMQPDDIVIEYDHGPGTAVFATCPPPSIDFGDRIRVRAQVTVSPWLLDMGTLTFRAQIERTILQAIPLDAPPSLGSAPPSPTPTATLAAEAASGPPPAPVNPAATSQPVGRSGKCSDIAFEWQPHPDWSATIRDYKVRHQVNGVLSPLVSLTAPPYEPSTTLNHGSTITFTVWATFFQGANSQELTITYRCQDGTLVEEVP